MACFKAEDMYSKKKNIGMFIWSLLFGACRSEDVSCTFKFAQSSTIHLDDLSVDPIVDAVLATL